MNVYVHVSLPTGVNRERYDRRLGLLHDLEQEFAEAGGGPRVQEHKSVYGNAAQMVRSPQLKAFDLSQEPDSIRRKYGRTSYGQSCLLARRLIEAGVKFVNVYFSPNIVATLGWAASRHIPQRVSIPMPRIGRPSR